ncbi:MAG: AraC family transcriptional regulator [Jatrophihabitans sp.]
MVQRSEIRAWRPDVAGIREVFYAHFTDHAYPSHTHDAWTLLLVDEGAVRYELDRHEHGALRSQVTLLPPNVPHDGRSASAGGFRKRVIYLDASVLGANLVGAAVDTPALQDPVLRDRIDRLHHALRGPGQQWEAASRLALICDRLGQHLVGAVTAPDPRPDPRLAQRLRDLLDERTPVGMNLDEAAAELHAHPTHLVRAFTQEFGLPPHRYLTGRRVDLARRLLLAGQPAAEVATAVGFYDQAHLTRHFSKMLGTTPGRYQRVG